MNLVTEQNLLVWMMNIVFLVLEMEMAHRVQFYLVHCAFLYPPKDLINYPSLGFTTREMPLKSVDKRARQARSHRPWVRRVRARCGQTEAATEQLIAAPAWPFYGTRPPLRNLCNLRTARAAGSGFRGRHSLSRTNYRPALRESNKQGDAGCTRRVGSSAR